MKLKNEIPLDIEIDKLTNSIENTISGEVFDTIIFEISDLKKIKNLNGLLIGNLKFWTKQNLSIA